MICSWYFCLISRLSSFSLRVSHCRVSLEWIVWCIIIGLFCIFFPFSYGFCSVLFLFFSFFFCLFSHFLSPRLAIYCLIFGVIIACIFGVVLWCCYRIDMELLYAAQTCRLYLYCRWYIRILLPNLLVKLLV